MHGEKNSWQLGFIMGIFHAIDPLGVAEYELEATRFLKWRDGLEQAPSEEQILAWFLELNWWVRVSDRELKKLTRALRRIG